MRADIEFFRIVAAFGIVWFHAELDVWRSIAYGGLIYFVILTSYFSMISNRQYAFFDRVRRILFPYFFWFIFYLLLLFLANKSINPKDHVLLSYIVASPSIHLWFLPFVFFVLCAVDIIKRLMNNDHKNIYCIFSALFAVIFIVTSPVWRTYALPIPLAQYIHVAAAVFIGAFISYSHHAPKYLVLSLVVMLIISMLWMVSLSQSAMGISYLVGFIPCLLLLTHERFFAKNSLILFFGSMSFGVYLIHMFWVMILRYSDVTGVLLPITSFSLSILCVWMMKRYLPQYLVKYII